MKAVCRTNVATSAESEEILAFLRRRGLLENAWLMSSVHNAFRWPEDCAAVIACRRGEELVGVAYVLYQTKVPDEQRAPGYKPDYDYQVQMEAVDCRAIEALMATLPTNDLGLTYTHRPLIQKYFDRLPGVIREPGDLYYTASCERFRPVAGEEVRELTAADAHLFQGCERQRNWDNMAEGSRTFGIVREGRAATSVGMHLVTPPSTTPRVIAMSRLHTETAYRRRGLAKRLVSYVTEMILRDGNVPMYWTEYDNIVSQGLAKGLGYQQYAQQISYRWRKPTDFAAANK
jgi:GNAT superfamily N-acetyltransferase